MGTNCKVGPDGGGAAFQEHLHHTRETETGEDVRGPQYCRKLFVAEVVTFILVEAVPILLRTLVNLMTHIAEYQLKKLRYCRNENVFDTRASDARLPNGIISKASGDFFIHPADQ